MSKKISFKISNYDDSNMDMLWLHLCVLRVLVLDTKTTATAGTKVVVFRLVNANVIGFETLFTNHVVKDQCMEQYFRAK